ncbi:MAG: hypothetical protein C4289_00915 [Chloroflexota bacterium]
MHLREWAHPRAGVAGRWLGASHRHQCRDRHSPGDVPHQFERFQRGTNVDDRRFTGMGLGLYNCRCIVEQHGGRIQVESIPGEGPTVRITLPLALEDVCCA